jgi:hypothetical protein
MVITMPRKKKKKTPLPVPVILVTQEVQIKRILVRGQPRGGESDPIPKIPNTKLLEWLKWYSTCLASVRPQVQTLVSPKKKKDCAFGVMYKNTKLSRALVAHICKLSYLRD